MDKEFAPMITHTTKEQQDPKKHHAYRLSNNGLLYFEDADHKAQLCMPACERLDLLKEVHDSAHASWKCTLATLRDRFYWPQMHTDVTNYVHTCNPCQKIKHN